MAQSHNYISGTATSLRLGKIGYCLVTAQTFFFSPITRSCIDQLIASSQPPGNLSPNDCCPLTAISLRHSITAKRVTWFHSQTDRQHAAISRGQSNANECNSTATNLFATAEITQLVVLCLYFYVKARLYVLQLNHDTAATTSQFLNRHLNLRFRSMRFRLESENTYSLFWISVFT